MAVGEKIEQPDHDTVTAIRGLSKIRRFAPYGKGTTQRSVNRSLAQVTSDLYDDAIRQGAQSL